MRKHRGISLLLGALTAFGCGGNAVDLGHGRDNQGWSDAPAQEVSSSTPQTIYDGDLPIIGFALDEPTLYALVYRAPTFDLISCPLERCRSQRTTLYSSPKRSDDIDQLHSISDTTLVVAGDRLFWLHGTDLMACPKTGCTEPQRVSSSVAGYHCFAADADTLYWLDGDGAVQRLKPNTDVPEQVRGPIPGPVGSDHLVVGGDYLYIASGADLPNIRRVRKDGTGSAELVVEDEAISGFSVVGDSMYYPSKILSGRIVECAPDDCARSAVTRANHQRWPMELRVAGDEAFWLTQTRMPDHPSNSDISSCRLPDCNPVEIRVADFPLESFANEPQHRPHIAVGPESLVWLEARLQEVGSSLRRLAR